MFGNVTASIEHITAGKLRALAVTTATRLDALPNVPTVGEYCAGLRGERMFRRRRAKGNAPKSSINSTRRSMRASPIRRSRRGLPIWAARCFRARPPTSASSSPTKPRSGARWSGRPTSSRSDQTIPSCYFEGRHETSPSTISASGSGRCRAPGRVAHRTGASLSDAAGAHDRRLCRRRGSNDIVARLIGQWLSERLGQQFIVENRPGAGSNIATEAVVRAPPDGYTLLLVTAAERNQRDALRQTQFQFHPRHRAGREHHARARCHGGQSIVSGQDRSRVHRLCQGQSGQDQHGVGRQRQRAHMLPASCSR